MPPTHARRLERTHAAPRHARRVSGPVRPPRADHAARAAAAAAATTAMARGRSGPRPAVVAPPRRARGATSGFERIRALPDHRVVDGLLRGRAWIWVIGVLLGGIVAMQVSLLKLNSGISRAVEQAGTLERVNADLETDVARLTSSERIQQTAERNGMVAPPAGDVGFLSVRPGVDARLAAKRMQPPSDAARGVMAGGGHAPAGLAPSTVTPAVSKTPAATPTTPAAAPTATAPVAAAATPTASAAAPQA